MNLPALVLCAGLGTRLQPLSLVRAKPALPVAGTPLITRILRWLESAGVSRVVVNLHHRADSITRLVGDGSRHGLKVRYSWEAEILGSAGGPARAIPLLEADRFLIVNGDMITNVDLNALAAAHVDTNALVTMAVIDGRDGYNGVIADHRGIVSGFGTAPGASHFIGVQVVNASVFAGVDVRTKSETVHGIYPSLIAGRPEAIRVFHSNADYFDIGSVPDYLSTAMAIAGRERVPLDRGRDGKVAATAVLTDTILWDRVSIGAGARLTQCVVADDVVVPAGAEFSRASLVMRENRIVATPF
ncbi:MAG: nucleotidyltransferase family protein [Acidimicrobiia bacterium]|nr:nucleotidyltransferase family protein [Acidimicrobiia bacterium]